MTDKKLIKIFYNEPTDELLLMDYVEKDETDDDTIFLEYNQYAYVLMNRAVFNQLENLEYIGEFYENN